MPVSRRTAEQFAREVADIYERGQTLMLQRIAKNLADGIEGPLWAAQKLNQLAAYQLQMRTLIGDLQRQAKTGAESVLTKAYEAGGLSALADLRKGDVIPRLAGVKPIEKLVNELLGNLGSLNQGILRTTMDAYRSVIADAATQALAGTTTRIQAAQLALDDFAAQGITGFIDAAGRGWSMEAYAEMATRASTMQASIQGHIDTLQENGLDLVIVSADGSPCELCVDWEGQILSSSGDDDNYPSLDEAEAAGLFHPNCLHSVSAYQEGITPDYPEKSDEEREQEARDYKDNQKLRYLERQVRSAKRVQAVAMDDAAKKVAGVKVKAYQAKIREHVDATNAVRQNAREQIGKAI